MHLHTCSPPPTPQCILEDWVSLCSFRLRTLVFFCLHPLHCNITVVPTRNANATELGLNYKCYLNPHETKVSEVKHELGWYLHHCWRVWKQRDKVFVFFFFQVRGGCQWVFQLVLMYSLHQPHCQLNQNRKANFNSNQSTTKGLLYCLESCDPGASVAALWIVSMRLSPQVPSQSRFCPVLAGWVIEQATGFVFSFYVSTGIYAELSTV